MIGRKSSEAGVGSRVGAAGGQLHFAMAVLCLILLFPLPAPALLTAACVAVTFAFLPGFLVAPLLSRGAPGGGRLLLALVLSPLLVGGGGAILLAAGIKPGAAARMLLVVLALASLATAMRRSRLGHSPPPLRDRGEGAILAIAVAWTAFMALVLLVNPRLIPRSDGWFHAAVAGEIANRGLPPEDPFFAGLPLLYFWGSHVWAALWPPLQPHLGIWAPLVVLNLSGALATLLGVMLLARRLGATPGGTKLAAALATLGYAPFAWGWVAARAAAGGVRGWPEIERIAAGGIAPCLGTMGTGLLHLSMVFFGGKFLVVTPFGLGLAIFLAFVLAALDFADAATPRKGILLLLLISSALFVHTFAGLCCLALAGGWWAWRLAHTIRSRGRGALPRGILFGLPAAVLGSLLLILPYMVAILHGKQSQLTLGLSGKAITTLLWGGALIVPPGVYWLWKRRNDGAARLVLLFAILMGVAGLLVDPSDNNQSKFMNLLFLLLAAPAGDGWIHLVRRLRPRAQRVLLALAVAAVAPTILLSVWAYVSEPGRRAEPGGDATLAERDAFVWAGRNTPHEAIFVEEGARRDAAVLAARSDLWGGTAWAKKWGYAADALTIRERAADELLSGKALSPDVARFCAGLGRPLIVVESSSRSSAASGLPTQGATRRSDRPIYDQGGVRLLAVSVAR